MVYIYNKPRQVGKFIILIVHLRKMMNELSHKFMTILYK